MINIYKFFIIILLIIIGLICSHNYSTKGEKLNLINKPYNKLIIVAHPDDESLWGYDMLKKNNGWKIICITNSYNSQRVNELLEAATFFNCALEIWNYIDNPFSYNMSPQIYSDLDNAINYDNNVKMVLTHNPEGEYGHVQHIKISNVVLTVSKKPTYVFSYSNKKNNEKCHLHKIYKSQKKTFLKHCNKNCSKIYRIL